MSSAFPSFTVGQKFGCMHRSREAHTTTTQHTKTQTRERSVDMGLICRFMLATHRALASVFILSLLPLSPQIPLPRHSTAVLPTYYCIPLTSCLSLQRATVKQGFRESPHAFTKSNSVFPSSRTSNKNASPWAPDIHVATSLMTIWGEVL